MTGLCRHHKQGGGNHPGRPWGGTRRKGTNTEASVVLAMKAAVARRSWPEAEGTAVRRTMARAFSLWRMNPVFWKIRATAEGSDSPVAVAV